MSRRSQVVVGTGLNGRAQCALKAVAALAADIDPLLDRLHQLLASEAVLPSHAHNGDKYRGRYSPGQR
jgi:hypothetical protein